ncbi:MAG: glycosyltransferase family 2 protein [Candidatus Helarchaeota archaeon]
MKENDKEVNTRERLDGIKYSSERPLISVIIPTLNEEKAIRKTIAEIPIKKLPPTEILVVDGISTDKTRKFAEKMGARIIIEEKRGYGRAIKTGVKNAKGKIIVWIDADYSYPALSIPKMIEPIMKRKADIVIGNRLNQLEEGSMVVSHIVGNVFLTLCFDFLFGKRIKDTQCGLRAFSMKAAKMMDLEKDGMPFATETLIEAVRKNLKIEQVDIRYRKRIGEPKLSTLSDGIKIFLTILKNKFKGK